MIEDGKQFSEVRPGVAEKELQASRLIRSFKDLPTAADVFDKALERITT